MSEHVLNELQLLTAMYDPADINFHDPEVLNLVENCIPITDSVSLSVRLNEFIELDIRLPLGYPETERLSAYCKISKKSTGPASSSSSSSSTAALDRYTVQQWESQFNNELSQNYLSSSVALREAVSESDDDNLPSILGTIQWCNEQFEKFPIPSEKNGRRFFQKISFKLISNQVIF